MERFPQEEHRRDEKALQEDSCKESQRLEEVRNERCRLERQMEERKKMDRAHMGANHQVDQDSRSLSKLSVNGDGDPEHRNSWAVLSSGSSRGAPQNEVDSWIDQLEVNRSSSNPLNMTTEGISPGILMASLLQQQLPKVDIPYFDGAALKWVKFIVTIRDVVHDQPFLNDRQKNKLLVQRLQGEAKRAVQEYANDPRGYPLSLKKLKYLFGQRPTVAKAVLSRVTKGKQVSNRDTKGLSDLYYSISECLVTLKQLNYESDLYSSATLDQAVRRLPAGLITKWAERSLGIRKKDEEPNLLHLELWLKDKVLVQKEVCQFQESGTKEAGAKKGHEESHLGLSLEEGICSMCKGNHPFYKCMKYKALKPTERMELVRKLKICFNCLSEGHAISECPSKRTCFQSGCGKKHHTTLHEYYLERAELNKAKRKKKKAKKVPEEEKVEEDPAEDQAEDTITGLNVTSTEVVAKETSVEATQVTVCATMSSKSVFLLIVAITVHVNGKSFDTYGLLDDGSQSTLIRQEFYRKIGAGGCKKKVYQTTIKDKAKDPMTVEELSLTVSARDGTNPLEIKKVLVQPTDMFHMPSRPRLENAGKVYEHLEGLHFEAVKAEDITMLIGGNVPKAHLYTDFRVAGDEDPVALKTRFGWTLFGPTIGVYDRNMHCSTILTDEVIDQSLECFWETEEPPTVFINKLSITPSDQSLHNAVERFWQQEHCGILPQREVSMSREDVEALQRMDAETRMINGKYEVPMLWASKDVSLPNNKPMAMKLFSTLQRKLKANPELHEKLKAIIHGYLEEDPPQARKMSPEEACKATVKAWTLPTHPVTNPNKPGKVRLVNNAAAEYQGVSLNSSLLTGPDLLNRLVGVLMRFRGGEVAIAADIEAMFHQVRVSTEDSDALRFLWKDDITSDDPPEMYQMLVHIFGAKDSPTCANYALQRTARDNHQNFDALTYYSATKAFYVDDLLKSVTSVESAKRNAEVWRVSSMQIYKQPSRSS